MPSEEAQHPAAAPTASEGLPPARRLASLDEHRRGVVCACWVAGLVSVLALLCVTGILPAPPWPAWTHVPLAVLGTALGAASVLSVRAVLRSSARRCTLVLEGDTPRVGGHLAGVVWAGRAFAGVPWVEVQTSCVVSPTPAGIAPLLDERLLWGACTRTRPLAPGARGRVRIPVRNCTAWPPRSTPRWPGGREAELASVRCCRWGVSPRPPAPCRRPFVARANSPADCESPSLSRPSLHGRAAVR